MKIKPKQYAIALYEAVKDKSKSETKEIIGQFLNMIKDDNKLYLIDKILIEFNKIWNKANGILEAEVSSSEPLDMGIIKDIKKYLKDATKAEEVETIENQDKNILGGLKLKFGDKIIDASLKTKISTLKEEMKR